MLYCFYVYAAAAAHVRRCHRLFYFIRARLIGNRVHAVHLHGFGKKSGIADASCIESGPSGEITLELRLVTAGMRLSFDIQVIAMRFPG